MSPKSGCLRTIRGCAWGRVQWRVARLPRVPTIVTPTPNPTPTPTLRRHHPAGVLRQHHPGHSLPGAGVTAGMIASADYFKAEGWTPEYAVKLLATPAALKKVTARRQGRAPNVEYPWGVPLQVADLCAILNGAKDAAHPKLTDAGGMQTARDAYLHQVVNNPAKVGTDLHVIEQSLSQALACSAVQVDTVAELPAPSPIPPACGTYNGATLKPEPVDVTLFITSRTLVQNGTNNLDLRCVLLPALEGARYKTNTSRPPPPPPPLNLYYS